MSPPAKKHLRWLQRRSKGNLGSLDRTPYDGWAAVRALAAVYGPLVGRAADPSASASSTYWTRRVSAAVVSGDARRTLNALRACAVRFSSF